MIAPSDILLDSLTEVVFQTDPQRQLDLSQSSMDSRFWL